MTLWLALALAFSPVATTTRETCVRCHSAQAREFKTHPHSAAGLGCEACHEESIDHRVSKGTTRPDRLDYRHRVATLCGACHRSELKSYNLSEHARLRLEGFDADAPDCVSCHGAHKLLTASQTERRCRGCHLASFIGSTPPVKGKISCVHCHSPHSSE